VSCHGNERERVPRSRDRKERERIQGGQGFIPQTGLVFLMLVLPSEPSAELEAARAAKREQERQTLRCCSVTDQIDRKFCHLFAGSKIQLLFNMSLMGLDRFHA